MESIWNDEPSERDYPAAQDYLELSCTPDDAAVVVANLRRATTVTKRAKDIIRSSGLPLLPRDNQHVSYSIDRAESGEKLNPILLVRGNPLVIADGYHRACAAYYVSEDTEVRCRIATHEPVNETAELAREAYAAGWAATDAPMTDRVKAGSIAAVEHACAHPDEPNILEVTMQLGALEGVWAKIYDRREDLYVKHTKAIGRAWKAWVADLDVRGLAKQFHDRPLGETTTEEQRRRDRRRAEALLLALLFLRRLKKSDDDAKYGALVAAVEAALVDGEAEGQAGAVAIAAQQMGYPAIDFDAAYQDAKNALAKADRFGDQARTVVDEIVDSAARDLARRLAADEDATEDDLDDAAADSVQTDNNQAVGYHTDLAMGLAFTAGILLVFTAIQVSTVNFVTVGDSRVCTTCLGIEASNPWPLLTVPQPAIHGGCRCTLEPTTVVVSLGRFAIYVLGGDE